MSDNQPQYKIIKSKDWFTDEDMFLCRVVLVEWINHPSNYKYSTQIQVKYEDEEALTLGHFYFDLKEAMEDFENRTVKDE